VTLLRRVGLPTAASFDAAVLFFPDDRIAATLAGKNVVVESDDASLLSALFIAFGDGGAVDDLPFFRAVFAQRTLRASINGSPLAPRELFFGLEDPNCPYRLEDDTIFYRDDDSAQFTIENDVIRVHETPRWRVAVTALLSRGFLHFIDDLVLFHAAAAGIRGNGALFVAARESGKSTIALALASRGHEFLSDEYGCYDTATHELLPYRRPVGIREGPRAAAISLALARGAYRGIPHEDAIRVDLGSLIPLAPPRRVPLRMVVFLEGFADRPRLRLATEDENRVEMLRTLYSSLITSTHARRTLDILRMLSRTRVMHLEMGDPDQTAALLEEELGS